MSLKKVGEFPANRSNGERIVIEVWDDIPEKLKNIPFCHTVIARYLKLIDGKDVEQISARRYLVNDTGEILTLDADTDEKW